MPLGNGEVGVNFWVEEDGDLLFYVSRTDAWSESATLLKLGRVRVSFDPNPFVRGLPFEQALKLGDGEIVVQAGVPGSEVFVRAWVDAHHPVVRVEVEGQEEFEAAVSLKVWRTKPSVAGRTGSKTLIVGPDTIVDELGDQIVWYHRNRLSWWPVSMKHQGLKNLMAHRTDPLLGRTVGGMVTGDGLVKDSDGALRPRAPAKRLDVSVFTHTAQTESASQWLEQIEQASSGYEGLNQSTTRVAHRAWWQEFSHRSWIKVSGPPEAETVSLGYALQRFVSACAGRGAFPIKFNGSIFTYDVTVEDQQHDADFRRWGGPYWFQNTRLAYWPMLASGDFDMMRPLFKMFLDALPLAEERTRLYFGHGGAFFPETMDFWGTYRNQDYGWDRVGGTHKGQPSVVREGGLLISDVTNPYVRWYWTGGIELVALMLDHYTHTQDDGFAREYLVPMVRAVLLFFDEHYPRDDVGKVRFEPSQSLETWQRATNPLPEIVGLAFVIDGLLSLPDEVTAKAQRNDWARLRRELPPVPSAEEEGQKFLLPADEFDERHNIENPELYAVFPFRLYGMGKPGIETGRATFERRREERTGGWMQDAIQAAYLGLTDVARKYTVDNFSTHHEGSRFPAFWGPNFDWVPDQDHGSVAIMALQSMLMQTEGERILLFPAWPEEWDVEFKLHAPCGTTVEGVYRTGKLERLDVVPAEREPDVVIVNESIAAGRSGA